VSNAAFSIVPIPDKRLTYTSGFSGSPAIAVQSANKLHVVWEDNTTGNFELYYKKSTDAEPLGQQPKSSPPPRAVLRAPPSLWIPPEEFTCMGE